MDVEHYILDKVVSWTTVESCGRQISVAVNGSWCGQPSWSWRWLKTRQDLDTKLAARRIVGIAVMSLLLTLKAPSLTLTTTSMSSSTCTLVVIVVVGGGGVEVTFHHHQRISKLHGRYVSRVTLVSVLLLPVVCVAVCRITCIDGVLPNKKSHKRHRSCHQCRRHSWHEQAQA